MEKEPILHMGSDKMISRHVYVKPFTIRFPDRSEWKRDFNPIEMGGWSGLQMAPRQQKARKLGCVAREQGENLVLALGSRQQYSRLKYTPLRHV
jgi:hypothetical protein